jgi:GNAT superfamily N-acetyltransferase
MSESTDSAGGYTLREAVLADAPILARQRRQMFDSIESLTPEQGTLLEAAILRYIAQAMPAGTFRSWVVERDGAIVSGGGLQLRTLMPRPGYVYGEPEGLIVSMWTDPEHRRRGLGRRIVEAILAWGRANGVTRFTLHASNDGRPLYELHGFRQTNEMRLESSSTDPDNITVERIS